MNYLNKSKIFSCLIVVLTIFTGVNAQNIKEDLLEISKKFNEVNFKMNVQMEVMHWNESLPVKISKGIIKRKENNYYTDFDNQISLVNNKYRIVVTKLDKQIIYLDLEKVNSSVFDNDKELAKLPEDEAFYKNAKLLNSDKSGNSYEITKPQYGIAKMKIVITKDGVLREIKYYYEKTEDSPVKEIAITYSDVVLNPTFSSAEFSEKKFFKIVNGKPVLNDLYSDYKIINSLSH